MQAAAASAIADGGEIRRDVLLVLLAAAAGAVDVISFVGLGQIFTANMAGNLVFFGLALGGGAGAQALRAVVAFAGFILGAAVAARIRGPLPAGGLWSRGVTVALGLAALGELGLFVGWASTGGHPGSGAEYALIAASALAMGARRARPCSRSPDVSTTYLTGTTTYLTGTMTALIVDSARGDESRISAVRRISVIVAFVAAAALAALLLDHARSLAPLVPVVLIGAVVAGGAVWMRSSRGLDEPSGA
jgi:uncharacterized membrane protein YoaK (UPF0700 family)